MRRIQVLFTKEQLELVEDLRGEMGNSISEVIRNVVMAWLSEKSFISTKVKRRTK